MRKVYVAGNWKMNKTLEETIIFVDKLKKKLSKTRLSQVVPIIFPPSLFLERCGQVLVNTDILVGSQDVSTYDQGAYTGEISASMLKSIGVKHCIVGHSERREYHQESNRIVNQKAKHLLANDIIPVICIGEKEEEREQGITEQVILQQLNESLADIEAEQDFIIAYEPVWAIGTGKTATPELAQEVHHLIRHRLAELFSPPKAADVPLLYGGSVKEENFDSLLNEEDIDGGLIGGASLAIDSYLQLINIAQETAEK